MNRIARTVLPLALTSAVVLGLAGCGGNGDSASASSASGTSAATSSTTSAETAASTTPATAPATAATSSAPVSQQKAEAIALATAGPGSAVVKTEADDEDGRAVWKVDVTVNGQKRKIEVDKLTGAVLKNETGD